MLEALNREKCCVLLLIILIIKKPTFLLLLLQIQGYHLDLQSNMVLKVPT
jgi:hypothetical protein